MTKVVDQPQVQFSEKFLAEMQGEPTSDLGVVLRTTPGKGEGVYAAQNFKVDELVVPGVVKVVLDGNHSHASQVGPKKWVLFDGINPKVNHSCNPNCGIRVNASGGHDIVARRPISEGEEVTYDYNMQNWQINHFPQNCFCGSDRCLGSITGFKDLPQSFIEDYDGYMPPYLLEMAHARQN